MKNELTSTRNIFLSIKPKFTALIVNQEKNYEFRKYRPKERVKKIMVYVTAPICALRYILEVDEVVSYPRQIPQKGMGNTEFNKGLKASKFAFPIIHVYELDEHIPLKELKEKFKFSPPQGYIYTDTFPELTQHIESRKLRQLY